MRIQFLTVRIGFHLTRYSNFESNLDYDYEDD